MAEAQADPAAGHPGIGVVIVAYQSADVIEDCLRSLLASQVVPRIVVCDNASPDDSAERVRAVAAAAAVPLIDLAEGDAPPGGRLPDGGLTLLRLPVNGGFAAGANAGLRLLLSEPEAALFWVLNPDCVVMPHTAGAYLACARAAGPFSLMGGRVVFLTPPQLIQADGARIVRWNGTVRSVNQHAVPAHTPPPDAATLDLIVGSNMVASRQFLETRGAMDEGFFLYYEEVEWAFRRGDLPLVFCAEAQVFHHGGTAIGSGNMQSRPGGFSTYFNFRNRMRFVARHMPVTLPGAYLYSLAKVAQMLLHRDVEAALAALAGLHQLPPPATVRRRLSPEALARATGRPIRRG